MLIEKELKTIKDLLKMENLKIPDYQRPYKWTERNVNQLIDDILFHSDKNGYRLGTLVLHKENNEKNEIVYNIVDGQQRTITIFLLAYCLSKHGKLDNKIDFLKFSFDNKISQNNIKNNYSLIESRIEEFDNFNIEFFLNKCELVKVVINDVQEAFQFFDSQNARGKDLEPHDLLKAFHLREMNNSTESEKIKVVEKWENLASKELANLFTNYLFKIKNWSKGNSAYDFTKNDIDIFKGVNLEAQNYTFMKQLQINNYYVDKQNEAERVNNYHFDYPFQIDQIVINGKRFFEMVIYYNNLIKDINKLKETFKKDTAEYDILNTLDTYKGHNRSGDRYVRNMFNCALVYYIDKFGKIDLDKAVKKLFIWAYNLRFKLYSVKLVSVDNYASDEKSIFRKLHYAINHNEILLLNINSIKKEEMKRKIQELEKFI